LSQHIPLILTNYFVLFEKSGVHPCIIFVSLSGSGKTYFWFDLAKNKDKIPIPVIVTPAMLALFDELQIADSSDHTKLAFFGGYTRYLLYIANYLSQQPSFQPVDFVLYMLNGGSAYLSELYQVNRLFTKISDIPRVSVVSKYVLAVDEAKSIASALPMTFASEPTANAITALNRAARYYLPVVFASTFFPRQTLPA